jgi:hypothetical protein
MIASVGEYVWVVGGAGTLGVDVVGEQNDPVQQRQESRLPKRTVRSSAKEV